MSKEEVIEIIRRAFADAKRPNSNDFVHCEQCELFLGRFLRFCPETWAAISAEDIADESSALTAVTPNGWRFLLPAYMVWNLNHYDARTDSNTVDNVVSNLTRDTSQDEHIAAGFNSLSRQQVLAVDAFLTFIAAQTHDPYLAADAAKARASYWAQAAAATVRE
jgi:hypothetical protein